MLTHVVVLRPPLSSITAAPPCFLSSLLALAKRLDFLIKSHTQASSSISSDPPRSRQQSHGEPIRIVIAVETSLAHGASLN